MQRWKCTALFQGLTVHQGDWDVNKEIHHHGSHCRSLCGKAAAPMSTYELHVEKAMSKVLEDDRESGTWTERVLRESRKNMVKGIEPISQQFMEDCPGRTLCKVWDKWRVVPAAGNLPCFTSKGMYVFSSLRLTACEMYTNSPYFQFIAFIF